jgi:hypothetical protein
VNATNRSTHAYLTETSKPTGQEGGSGRSQMVTHTTHDSSLLLNLDEKVTGLKRSSFLV